ncbi:hypothetical protein KKB55_21105, partial [Myxococcota bacterium]|nr:hypothetical protein [Myxococcota bacterium]
MPKIRIEHKTSNQYPYSAFKIILDQADSTIFIKELSGIGTSVIKADGNILNWIVANYNNQPIYFTDNHHTTPVHINDYINQQEIEVKSDTFSISYSAQKEIKLTCVVIHKERKNPIILSSSAIKQKFPPDIDEKIANLITEQQYISDQLKSISENQHQHELFIQRVNAFNDLNSIYEKVMSNLNQTIESRFAGYESNV